MPSHDQTPDKGVPFSLSRHRVDSPELYRTWREYAFSNENDQDGAEAADE